MGSFIVVVLCDVSNLPQGPRETPPTHTSDVLNIGLVGVLWHRLSGKYLKSADGPVAILCALAKAEV
jgi:hypothetical protein